MNKPICPYCNTPNVSNSAVCANCGADLRIREKDARAAQANAGRAKSKEGAHPKQAPVTTNYKVLNLHGGRWRLRDNTLLTCTDVVGEVVLPDEITAIEGGAFRDCTQMTAITLHAGLMNVGGKVFEGCTSLAAITVANNAQIGGWSTDWRAGCQADVTYVLDLATATTAKLTDFEYDVLDGQMVLLRYHGAADFLLIPPTMEDFTVGAIGERAFKDCALTSIFLPAGVTKIGVRAFEGCRRLSNILVAGGNRTYRSQHNCLIETSTKTLVVGCNKSVIPADGGVTAIGSAAFVGCTGLTDLYIPDSVTSIADGAFLGCTGLARVHVPASITHIGPGAFADCAGLSQLDLPDTLRSIGTGAFEGCTGLAQLDVPAGAALARGALLGCTSLQTLRIPYVWQSLAATDGDPQTNTFAFVKPDGWDKVYAYVFDGGSGPAAWPGVELAPNQSGGYVCTAPIRYNGVVFNNGQNQQTVDIRPIADGATYVAMAEMKDGKVTVEAYTATNMPLGWLFARTDIPIDNSAVPDTLRSVTFLGGDLAKGACQGCTQLTEVTILGAVKTIGAGAFDGCSSLTKIDLMPGIETIAARAFRGCRNLTNLNIPSTVTDVERHAFDECDQLVFNTFDKAVYLGNTDNPYAVLVRAVDVNILRCTVHRHTRTIMAGAFADCASLESVQMFAPLARIGAGAFRECTSLTAIALPDSVTHVGEWAFLNCSALQSVDFGKGLTYIGHDAFAFCDSLKSITLPDSVTHVGERAFDHCTGLVSMDFGKGVTEIGVAALQGCEELQTLTIPFVGPTADPAADPKDDLRRYWFGYLFDEFYYKRFKKNENLFMPDVVSDDVFCIPASLHTVHVTGHRLVWCAFMNCVHLTSIVLDDVTQIGSYAFSGCTGLAEMRIPDGITFIGISAFEGCAAMTTVRLPNTLEKISNRAFRGCKGLTDIILPDSVTHIGDKAFEDCTALTSIRLPDDIVHIGVAAFQGCTAMCAYRPTVRISRTGDDSDDMTALIIPDSATDLGASAFAGCKSLRKIVVEQGVRAIPQQMFEGCSGLRQIVLPPSVAEIGSAALRDCGALGSIILPPGINVIESSTFRGCGGLTSVSLPDNLTKIGKEAFAGCSGLTSVNLPDSLTTIEELAFQSCNRLTSVSIPDKAPIIEERTFEGCSALHTVTIGRGVTTIKSKVFDGCNALRAITLPDSVTNVDPHAFDGLHLTVTASCAVAAILKVCAGIDEIRIAPCAGIADNAFRGFAHLPPIRLPEGLTAIGKGAFGGCGDIDVTIPDSITDLDSSAFDGCDGMTLRADAAVAARIVKQSTGTEIKVVCSGTRVPAHAFEHCANLTNVTLGSGITALGESAFHGCCSLQKVELPLGLTEIPNGAFQSCNQLTFVQVFGKAIDMSTLLDIIIPEGVTSIGEGAFAGCSALGKESGALRIPASVTRIQKEAFLNCAITTIRYGGTTKQWKAVKKGKHWDKGMGKYTVICQD